MKEILCQEVDANEFFLGETQLAGGNKLDVAIDHWEGGMLDMDLEVSYDNGQTWAYGGGCKGATSAPPSVEFHLKYGSEPTHVRGTFSSDAKVTSRIRIFSGE